MCDRSIFIEPIIDGLDLSIPTPSSLKNIICVIYSFRKDTYERGYYVYPKRSRVSISYRFGIYLEFPCPMINYDKVKSCLVGSISGTINSLMSRLSYSYLRCYLSPINHFNTPDIKIDVPAHSNSSSEFIFNIKKDQFEYIQSTLRTSMLPPSVIDVALFDSWVDRYIRDLFSIDLDDYYRPYDTYEVKRRRLRDLWKDGFGRSLPVRILCY